MNILMTGLCALGLFVSSPDSREQRPLYIVNGVECEDISSIPPDDILSIETLPADEHTIGIYGQRAANGVMLITLREDEGARFPGKVPFGKYIAARVKWDADEPAARVVLRYRISPAGVLSVDEVLESTDNRLRKRVLRAVKEAPVWRPAMKDGKGIASDGILSIQLPEGKPMPRPAELVWR